MDPNFFDYLWAVANVRIPPALGRQNEREKNDVWAIVHNGCSISDWRLDDEFVYGDRRAAYKALIGRCKADHAHWLEKILEIVTQAWTELADDASPLERERHLRARDAFIYETDSIPADISVR